MPVQIIADSISDCHFGERLTTFLLRYERLIHPELLTHRMFSRSSESSRAVNSVKRASLALYIPDEIGRDCKGMQRKENLTGLRKWWARLGWRVAIWGSRLGAKMMRQAGGHKQHTNRPLDWCGYVEVVVTSDAEGLANFFMLRNHVDAQPEMQTLAKEMWDAYNASIPVRRAYHIPWDVGVRYTFEQRFQASAGYIAGISYLSHGTAPVDKAIALGVKMCNETPPHHGPYEHQAISKNCFPIKYYNLRGWKSQRYIITEKTDDLSKM